MGLVQQLANADRAADSTKRHLESLEYVSKTTDDALKKIKLIASQVAETDASAEFMRKALRKIATEADKTQVTLDRVRIGAGAAFETTANGDVIDRKLKDITGNANEARRAIEGVKLASAAPTGGGAGGGGMMPPVGMMPAAIGAGALLAPAAGPGALGLLASIPVVASTGAGALGTLMLSFQGVTKAIGGNKKAFLDLGPSAQSFVLTVRSLDGWFDKLKQTAGAALFPGLTAGLKAALSPGTVQAITQAVTAFGHAIGDAGAMFGRYFGSSQFQSIFGPLMQAGAKNLGLMASASLRLFDAVGVLGRAAIPLVDWMVKGADAAARWVDSFTRAKDATGGLNGAMNEAKSSLQLVGRLFASLLYAVYELGKALYPVSKVAVKALTDGLFALGQIIDKNRGIIREIVGTALSAFIGAVKVAAAAVRLVNDALSHLVGDKSAITTAILGIGIAMMVAFGPEAVAVTGAIVAIGLIQQHWAAFSTWVVNIFKWVARQIGSVFALIPSWINPGLNSLGKSMVNWGNSTGASVGSAMGASLSQAFQGALNLKSLAKGGFTTDLLTGKPNPAALASGGALSSSQIAAMAKAKGLDPQAVLSVGKMEGLGGGIGDGGHAFGPFQLNNAGGVITNMFPGWTNAQIQKWAWSKQGVNFALTKMAGVAGGQSGYGAIDSIVSGFERPKNPGAEIAGAWNSYSGGAGGAGSPLGTPPPFTTGLSGQTTPKQRAAAAARALAAKLQIPVTNDQTLVAHYASLAASANTGPEIAKYLDDEAAALKKENVALLASMQGKTAAQDAKIKQTISKNQDIIAGLHEAMVQALDMSKDESAFAKFQAKLKTLTAKFTADSDYATVLTGQVAADYQNVIRKDLLNQAAVLRTESAYLKSQLIGATGKRKTEIQAKLTSITSSLDTVQGQILSSLQSTVTTLQGKVSTLFSAVQSQIDAAFQAQTQAMIDQLGTKFMQNGGQTPGEAQLAAMQAQDALQSQLDSIQQAKDQLSQDQGGSLTGVVYDAATGITKNIYNAAAAKQIAADQKNLDAANRQYDEYMLGIKAADERLAADTAYATQLKALQDSRTAAETALNQQISDLSDAFQNGVGSMQALSDIAARYGIQITLKTIPDFDSLSSASGQLAAAFQILVDWITKIDGIAPKIPTDSSGAATAGGGGTGLGGSTGPGAVLQDLHNQVVAGILSPADYNYLISGHKLNIPGMASGGIVRAKPGGTLVRLAEAGQDEQVGPVGGGGGGATSITVNVSGSVLTEGDLVDAIYAGLLRKRNRNGGKLNLN